VRNSWMVVWLLCALVLSGCSGTPRTSTTQTETSSIPGAPLHGIVHGGQQPIVGARVYLYAANTTGYGNGSVSLLASTGGTTQDGSGNYYVTTQSRGTFSITGDYSCPSAGSQVYLYSIGGNPGLGQGTNSAAGLMAALGTCGSLSTSTFAVVNEVSTIATAYAIAGFATDATHVSSSSSQLATATDVPNAFATVTNLESLSSGLALAVTPAGNGAAPQAEIYTLADILGACVNSAGPSSTPCSTLFGSAMNGNSQPVETATAAINIAHNPGSNVATLYGLLPSDLAFQPTLGAAPDDFTIAITYSGGGLDGTGFAPEGIAVDASGNVWVPNYLSNTISAFNPNGAPLTGSPYSGAGLSEPTSIALDEYGNAWAANFNGDDVSEFNSKGQKISNPPGWVGGGLNKPYGIAIDNVGHAWVANFGGNSMSEFSSSLSFGLAISPSSGFTSDTLAGPAGIASDTSGDVWTANYAAATSSLEEAVPSSLPGQPPTFTLFSGGGLSSPYGVAIDGSGNVWATNRGGDGSISEFTSSGQAVSGAGGYGGGGVSGPYGIAIDGAGNVWTANNGGNSNSVSEFNPSGTAISGDNGYVSGGLLEPYGIATDGSGNVWVASDNTSGPLTEYVGAAVPVVTPISAGTAYKQLGTRP
jgi:streptogramin lyase